MTDEGNHAAHAVPQHQQVLEQHLGNLIAATPLPEGESAQGGQDAESVEAQEEDGTSVLKDASYWPRVRSSTELTMVMVAKAPPSVG